MAPFKRLMQDHQDCEHWCCAVPNTSNLKVNTTAAANKGETVAYIATFSKRKWQIDTLHPFIMLNQLFFLSINQLCRAQLNLTMYLEDYLDWKVLQFYNPHRSDHRQKSKQSSSYSLDENKHQLQPDQNWSSLGEKSEHKENIKNTWEKKRTFQGSCYLLDQSK